MEASIQAAAAGGAGGSVWSEVPLGPPDAILGITEAFKADQSPDKINLGVGAYRDDNGKPVVLQCVQEAEKRLLGLDKEYAPISGIASYVESATRLAYGEELYAELQAQGRLSAVQTISGTGALRVGAAFLSRYYPTRPAMIERQGMVQKFESAPLIMLPSPTWGNHGPIMQDSWLPFKTYRYFDASTNGLDLQGMLGDLQAAEDGAIILLHACAHNPTGVDPTEEQWSEIARVIKVCDLLDMSHPAAGL